MISYFSTLSSSFLLIASIITGPGAESSCSSGNSSVHTVHDHGGRPLRIIIRQSNLRPSPEPGQTFTALSENGSSELHVLGPGLAPFWDIQDMLNFSLRIFVTKQRGGIVEQFNVSTNGVGPERGPGDLLYYGLADVNQIYDIEAAVLHRGHFVYLHPVLVQHVYVFFKQPSVILFRSIYREPFSGWVWLCLLLVYGFVLLLLLVSAPHGLNLDQLSNCALWTVSAFSLSGYSLPNTKNSFTLNLVTLTAGFLSTVTLTVYTGLITSTFELRVDPIRSLRGLLDYNYQFVGSPSWDLHHETTEFTQDADVAAVIFKSARKNFKSFDDIPVKVLNSSSGSSVPPLFAGIHAMHSFWVDAKGHGFSASEICGASFFPSIATYKYGMLVRKGSPLREVQNRKILQILESGINRHHEARHLAMDKCPERAQYENGPINLVDTRLAFYVMAFGHAAAVVFAAFEKLSLQLQTKME